jgi:dihydroflavonol-4-reductase
MELKPANRPKPYSVNETFWSEVDGNHISAYSKSKTLAERAAWEYQKA